VGIGRRCQHPQASLRVEGQRHWLGQLGEFLLRREQVDFVACCNAQPLERYLRILRGEIERAAVVRLLPVRLPAACLHAVRKPAKDDEKESRTRGGARAKKPWCAAGARAVGRASDRARIFSS
jgi:hypothetical protein